MHICIYMCIYMYIYTYVYINKIFSTRRMATLRPRSSGALRSRNESGRKPRHPRLFSTIRVPFVVRVLDPRHMPTLGS